MIIPLNNQPTNHRSFVSLRAVDVGYETGHAVALWLTAQPGVPPKKGVAGGDDGFPVVFFKGDIWKCGFIWFRRDDHGIILGYWRCLKILEDTWTSLLIHLDETLWLILQMYSNVRSSPLSPVWSKLWALDIWTYQECDSLQKVICSPEGRGMHTELWHVHDDWFPMNSNWIESLYLPIWSYLSVF